MSKTIHIKKTGLIVYDFDGVLTDNRVILREDGLESVIVNRSDGLAIEKLRQAGIRQIIFTTEKNKVAAVRARKLKIPIEYGLSDKRSALITYCGKNRIPLDKVIYIGNDINDLEAMKIIGYPICPSDASTEVKKISKIVLNVPGGAGVAKAAMDHLVIS